MSGTALILGGGAWLWHRVARLERRQPGGAAEGPRLRSELEEVRRELDDTREETRRLSERVDFLERLLEAGERPRGERRGLVGGRPGGEGPGGSDTPG